MVITVKKYELGNVALIVHNLHQKEIDEQQLLNKILVNNDEKIESLYKEMLEYKKVLQYIDDDNARLNKINERISIHFPLVKELNYGRTFVEEKGSYDTNYIFVVSWANDSSININYQAI